MVVGGSGLGLGIDPCSRFRFCYFWNENKEAVKKEKGHFPSRQKFHPLARGESGAHGRGVRDIVLDDGCGNDFFWFLHPPKQNPPDPCPPFLTFPAKFEVIVLTTSSFVLLDRKILATQKARRHSLHAATAATHPPSYHYHLFILLPPSAAIVVVGSRPQFVVISYHLLP